MRCSRYRASVERQVSKMAGVTGFRAFTKVDRAETELVELFRDIPVCNIVDCMNKLAAVQSTIKPLNRVKVLGTAITVKAPIGDNLMFHAAISYAKAGDVIVVDGGGCTERSICGENMMQIARQKGVHGFVVDGSIRDSAALDSFDDFNIFAKAIMPNASYKGQGPGELNVPICVGGQVVYPGDIIVGDDDGVVAIRPKDAQMIAEEARKLMETEAANLELIKKGMSDHSWVDKALSERGCIILEKHWYE